MFKRDLSDSELMQYLKNEGVLTNSKKVTGLPVIEYWKNDVLVAVVVFNGALSPACIYTYNQK